MADKMKKSTVQSNLPEKIAATIRKMADSIPDEDLAGHGRDTGPPHVTVRWGLEENDVDGIRRACLPHLPFIASLGKTKIFPPSQSSEGAAVVYVEVRHPNWEKMNEALEHFVKCCPATFDYTPHATVCYVKPEVADKYRDLDTLEGTWWPVTSVLLSDRDKKETEVKK